MNKIDYIKKIESEDLIFSVLQSSYLLSTTEKLDKNPNLKIVYTESNFEAGKVIYYSKLFKSDTGFFIYLKKHMSSDNISKYELTIYHIPTQINEIIIFLKFLNK